MIVEVHVGSSWYELRLGIRIFVQFPVGSQCWVKIKITVSLMGTFLLRETFLLRDIQHEYS